MMLPQVQSLLLRMTNMCKYVRRKRALLMCLGASIRRAAWGGLNTVLFKDEAVHKLEPGIPFTLVAPFTNENDDRIAARNIIEPVKGIDL